MEKKIIIPRLVNEVQVLDNHPRATKRILIMEDDPELVRTIQDVLAPKGLEPTFVKSAAEGLREIRDHEFDVVICNVTRSVFAGEMFYRAVERVKPHLCRRFIYVTGHSNETDDAFISRVNGIKLWKPFEMHVLIETINVVLKKGAARAPRPADWQRNSPPDRAASPSEAAQNIFPIREIQALMRLAFASVRKSICFATNNFSPDESLIKSLTNAAGRGVRIQVIVPGKTETSVRKMIPVAVQNEFVEAGIEMFETRSAMEFNRIVVFDERWACVTCSRLFHENINVYQDDLARRFLLEFQRYRGEARPISKLESEKLLRPIPLRTSSIGEMDLRSLLVKPFKAFLGNT